MRRQGGAGTIAALLLCCVFGVTALMARLGLRGLYVTPTGETGEIWTGRALPGGGRLYHLDLYRIANSASALAFGVDEFLDDPESVALVEWPERIADILPPGTLRVEIVHLSENERRITVRG